MTKSGRKGHAFEDKIVELLVDHLACHPDEIRRRIGAETGTDIVLSPALRQRFRYAVECKKRARIVVHSWLDQAKKNAAAGETPIVICAQDRGEPLVIMRLDDFLKGVQE